MKISVSDYSFSKLYKSGAMTQIDCIKKAKELGSDAIEFTDLNPNDGQSKLEFAATLKAESEKVGLPIIAYLFGADFLKNDDEITRAKGQIDVAQALGVKMARHDATYGSDKPFGLVVEKLANACREITEYAKSKGIKTMIENHGMYCQDSLRVEKLYCKVNHENFGLLVDIGNFLCADEEPEHAVSRVAPLAFHVHAKDFYKKSASEPNPGEGYFETRSGNFLKGTIIGHGNVPVYHCLKALKKAKYDGAVTVEFEGMEDPIKGISIGLENLKKYISMVNDGL